MASTESSKQANTMTTGAGTHILLYPYPAAGHIIPIIDLATQLLRRGLTLTVLVTPTDLPLLQPFLSAGNSSLQPLVLPSPPQQTENRLPATVRGLYDLHYTAIVDWFRSHPSPPVAIVSDFFLGWTQPLAAKLGIVRVIFSPSGAFGLSVSFSLWRDVPEITESDVISFPKLPNCPSYTWWQIPEVYRDYLKNDESKPQRRSFMEFHRTCMVDNLSSWGLVYNSFADIEKPYLEYMKREVGHDRVYAVGPLLPPEVDSPADRGGSSSVPPHEVLTWLDSCPDQSAVYICFGSRVTLTRHQIKELTSGLEMSGVHFVLSIRDPDDEHKAVIDEFQGRVVGKGMVIRGWAPQVLILRHRAVGAFLTHCGWNSTLEGVSAGVVMLTWPMNADQFTNAKLIVDELGVGIRVGEGTEIVPNRAELAYLIREAMRIEPLRVKAEKMKQASMRALEGSSAKDLDEFVKKLNELKSLKL